MILSTFSTSLIAQCPAGQTYDTYCYGPGEINNVAFEFCPTSGDIAQSTIIAGAIGGVAPINDLTVYEGASGSGIGGTIVFGPMSSNPVNTLPGTVITASAADLCLIFVINSVPGVPITCSDGFDAPLEVCSESLAGATVTFTAPADLCINAGVQTGLSGGSPAGGVYSGAGVTDNGNGMTYSFDPAVASVGTHTLTYTNGGSATDDIEVFALPTVTFTALADLCIDAGEQTGLSGGSPGGGVYSGSGVTDNGDGTYDFDPAAAGLGIHTITYTESSSCMSSTTDMVEVLAACGCPASFSTSHFHCSSPPEVNLVIFEVCPSAGMAAQATIIQGTYSAGFGNNLSVYEGASGSGLSGTLLSGPLTGDLSGILISGNGAGNCLIFVSNVPALGCNSGAETALKVCGESIASSVTFTALADLCIDAGVQPGLSGGLPTGGVYSGPGVTDDGNGMTYSFDPAAATVGTHILTYTQSGTPATDDVEVFALGTTGCLSFIALDDLCIDAGLQTGLGGGLPTGGIYSGTGVTDDGNGMTYSFDPAAAGVGTHILTYTQGGNSATDDVEVFATPTVTLDITTNSILCIDAPVTLYTLTAMPTGGVFSGNGVTNLGDGSSFTLNPAIAGVGTHTVTYSVTDANGCTGMATDDIQVVGPAVAFTAPADLCLNAGVQAGLGGGTPTGGVYSGTGVTDDGNGMTYTFDPAAASVGTHTITYTFTDTNGCTGSASDDVEVFALPTVTMAIPAGEDEYCLNDLTAGISLAGSPTGGVYSGAGVTDLGTGITFTFNPANAGVGTHTVTYTFTDANGCTGSATDNIIVLALPVVNFTAPADLCVDAGVQAGLGGGTPPQGTITGDMGVYSGAGVTDDGNGMTYSFDPAVATAGTHSLTYSVSVSGCMDSASDDVEVFALPLVTFNIPGVQDTFCIDSPTEFINGGSPVGGVYSGPGVTDNGDGMTFIFDPAAAGLGLHIFTYTFTDANGCSEDDTDFISVQPLPMVNFTAPADLCLDAGVQVGLGGGTPPQGTQTFFGVDMGVYSGTGVTDDGNGMTYSFDPAIAGVGIHTITYTLSLIHI